MCCYPEGSLETLVKSVVQLCCGRSTLTLERFETNYSESLKTSGQETICSWSLPRIAAHLFTRTTSVTVPHSPGQKQRRVDVALVILQSIVTFLQLFPPTLSIQSSSALKCANSSLLSLDTVGGLCYRCDCEALGKASLCQRVTHKNLLTTSERTRRGTSKSAGRSCVSICHLAWQIQIPFPPNRPGFCFIFWNKAASGPRPALLRNRRWRNSLFAIRRIDKRAKYSRRRAYNDDADIDYINERNAKFNKKAERFYGKYTAEIKQNLERGTAV